MKKLSGLVGQELTAQLAGALRSMVGPDRDHAIPVDAVGALEVLPAVYAGPDSKTNPTITFTIEVAGRMFAVSVEELEQL